MSRPFFPLLSRRHFSLAAGLGGLLAASGVQATNFPISTQQRGTAQQVAQTGVPLSELAPDAPDSHTVKRGDTLWGISRLFLRSPWRWPELWGMNLEQIRNPHLIYPGQILVLVKSNGKAMLVMGRQVGESLSDTRNGQLRPRVRENSQFETAIASIPMHLIGPFLNEAAVFDTDQLLQAPRIVATQEGRVLLSRGEIAYVRGDVSRSRTWQIFREPRALLDPDTKEILGYEARHVGVAERVILGDVNKPDSSEALVHPSTMTITHLREEATQGDRLAPLPPQDRDPFVPHAPIQAIQGRVVSVYGDSLNAGQNQIVAINRGLRDGMERGHVLELWRAGERRMDTTSRDRATLQLPDERSGLLFVFRVFERVSYALILQTQDPVRAGDRFTQP